MRAAGVEDGGLDFAAFFEGGFLRWTKEGGVKEEGRDMYKMEGQEAERARISK